MKSTAASGSNQITFKMAIAYLSKTDPRRLRGTALLRFDFNTEDGWRMKAVLPTIKKLLKTARRVVIVSHRGRPHGFARTFSLRSDARRLARLVQYPVHFVDHFRFAEIRKVVVDAPRGSIFLLENLRFLKGEERNSAALAHKLASLADFYVNDAFAVSHRANASIAAITKFLPSYAGLELENEIRSLSRAMRHPAHPLVVILGGAKASDKLGIIRYFKDKADTFLLGGGPANTILWLRGTGVKKSVRDRDPRDIRALHALSHSPRIVVPQDFKWHGNFIWDIGPRTVKAFALAIRRARTILWSGPLGLIERKAFARGSVLVARAVTRNRHAFSVAGGGETVMFLKQYGLDKRFSFISTGGGAMVDFLAGRKLPGIEALRCRKRA